MRLALIILAAMTSSALAQDARGLGHPAANAPHWYDAGCCSGMDCEPLQDGAVVQTSKGFHVKYRSSRGFYVDEIVAYHTARPSRDAQFHGCATPVRFLCLYVPMTM